MQKTKIFLFLLFISVISFGQNLSSNSTGSFTYTPESPLNNKSIEVFYHIPAGDITKMPILFSFHGVNRNADDYRDYWISMANANKFMVFAPQFSDEDFPTGDAYNLANIFDDGDNPSTSTFNNKNEWTFSTIDPIFETIKAAISGTQEVYNAWGHSAGAQFLHRFVTYLPNSKLDIAVCSNAGWYTVPEFSVDFPYGIKNGQLPNSDLIKAFSKKLIVHLGKSDNDPNAGGLRHNTVVDNQQGLHRFQRGNYYFETSKTTAQTLNTPFNWEKEEVSGVSHQAQKMANAALEHILKSTLTTSNFRINKPLDIFPNPVESIFYFDNSKLKSTKIYMYAVTGKLVSTYNFNEFKLNQKIDISKLSTGIYFLKTNRFISKILKK